MLKDTFTAIQGKLNTIQAINYVGEDWGQLDYYSDRPPTRFPCVLFDVGDLDYVDRTAGIQDALGTITLRVADSVVRNVSSKAPDADPGKAYKMYDLLEDIHKAIHGLEGETFKKLKRVKLSRVLREDGIREYVMKFKFSGVDTSAFRR